MKVKFKKLHENAVLPKYAKEGDAGMDLTATSLEYDEYSNHVYGTGLSIEIPDGYVGLLFPRSSNRKTDLRLTNSVGIIDSGFRGEIKVIYRNDKVASSNSLILNDAIALQLGFDRDYEIGDRIGQIIIIPYPQIEPEWADELSETVRGEGGFGSTGN